MNLFSSGALARLARVMTLQLLGVHPRLDRWVICHLDHRNSAVGAKDRVVVSIEEGIDANLSFSFVCLA
jgi:hypothetical protein